MLRKRPWNSAAPGQFVRVENKFDGPAPAPEGRTTLPARCLFDVVLRQIPASGTRCVRAAGDTEQPFQPALTRQRIPQRQCTIAALQNGGPPEIEEAPDTDPAARARLDSFP